MAERPSSPEKRHQTTIGIWLIFITPQAEIFTVRNLAAKYVSQKVPGQLNAPAETYKPGIDQLGFVKSTIPRAIMEEVGTAKFDPCKVKLLGFIRLQDLDQQVVAVPYLIPVEGQQSIIFNPQDQSEADSPQWTPLDEIKPDKTFEINGFTVPLFRSPMAEIAQLIRASRKTPVFPRILSAQPSVPKELIDLLKVDPGTQKSTAA